MNAARDRKTGWCVLLLISLCLFHGAGLSECRLSGTSSPGETLPDVAWREGVAQLPSSASYVVVESAQALGDSESTTESASVNHEMRALANSLRLYPDLEMAGQALGLSESPGLLGVYRARNSDPVSDRQVTGYDHGVEDIPATPEISHFGVLETIFFFKVLGPAGSPYTLQQSTDLENWDAIGEATTDGNPNSPAGFVFIGEIGDRYYVRIIR